MMQRKVYAHQPIANKAVVCATSASLLSTFAGYPVNPSHF